VHSLQRDGDAGELDAAERDARRLVGDREVLDARAKAEGGDPQRIHAGTESRDTEAAVLAGDRTGD
jgi:hypothetical protein